MATEKDGYEMWRTLIPVAFLVAWGWALLTPLIYRVTRRLLPSRVGWPLSIAGHTIMAAIVVTIAIPSGLDTRNRTGRSMTCRGSDCRDRGSKQAGDRKGQSRLFHQCPHCIPPAIFKYRFAGLRPDLLFILTPAKLNEPQRHCQVPAFR